jgi:hypothetical protein
VTKLIGYFDFFGSIEESGLRRRSVLWKQSRANGGRFAIQMGQDSRDHRWVFNASNDLDLL